MNVFEKILTKGVIAFGDAANKLDNKIEQKIGFSPTDKLIEMDEADEELRHNSPVKWTAKKLAKGTIMGILGASFHND